MARQGERRLAYIDVANENEVPVGTMLHVEAAGREVLLANVNGVFHATTNRCSHEGARLSGGRLDGEVVTCPVHGSRFDVTTGRNLSGPVMAVVTGLEQLCRGLGRWPARRSPRWLRPGSATCPCTG